MLPTRVGMDRHLRDSTGPAHGAPHTRGDGPASPLVPKVCPRCSPHAWGWTASRVEDGEGVKVLPTRVGMDRKRYAS